MAALLNTSSMLMCPHGGTVTAISSNAHSQAASGAVLRSSDTFTIAGCSFAPGGTPHPCVQVKWFQTDQHSKTDAFTLSQESVGFCVAGDQAVQGTVIVSSTQARASGI